MKKLIITLICILSSINIATAKNIPNFFDKAFNETGISKHAVSFSVQDIDRPKKIYELNSEKPMMPASTQKIITTLPAL